MHTRVRHPGVIQVFLSEMKTDREDRDLNSYHSVIQCENRGIASELCAYTSLSCFTPSRYVVIAEGPVYSYSRSAASCSSFHSRTPLPDNQRSTVSSVSGIIEEANTLDVSRP